MRALVSLLCAFLLLASCARSEVFDPRRAEEEAPAIAPPDAGFAPDASAPPGDSPPKLKTFVLVMRSSAQVPHVGPLELYDAEGGFVRDLAANLELGPEYTGVRVSVGSRVVTVRSPERSSGRNYSLDPLPGQPFSPLETQVVLRAFNPTKKTVRLVGLAVTGASTFDREVPGDYDDLQLSPSGGYLLATYGGGKYTIVLDVKRGGDLVLGDVVGAAIREDDAEVTDVGGFGSAHELSTTPLPSGPTLLQPQPSSVHSVGSSGTFLRPLVALRSGTLFGTSGDVTFGTFLYFATPRHAPLPLGPLQRGADEHVDGFSDDGRTLVFSRTKTFGASTVAPLGVFATDLGTLSTTALPGETGGLFTPAGFYALDDKEQAPPSHLSYRPLRSSASASVANLPLYPDGWRWGLGGASEDGGRVLATAQWVRNAMPQTFPSDGTRVFARDGNELFSGPVGGGALDRTGRVLVHQLETAKGPGPLVLTSVDEKSSVTLNPAPWAFVYAAP